MSSISSLSGLGGYNSLFQINAQSLQQRQDNLFSKIDTNGNGGIDKAEFSDLAKKLAEHSGNSINVDDVFKTYDTNSDGTLSSDEMKAFMKDNAPPPPQMQNASSAYGASQGDGETSALLEVLKNISAQVQSSSGGNASSLDAYLSKLVESITNGTGSSVLNVAA